VTEYTTDVGTRVADFEAAVRAGEVRTAADHAVAIESATPDLLAGLEDLRDALVDGDDGTATTLAVKLGTARTAVRAERATLRARADHVATALEPRSNAARTLSGLVRESAALEGALGTALPTAQLFLEGDADSRDRGTRLSVVEDVERALEAERTYRSVRSNAEDVLSELDVDRPPRVVLAAVQPDARSFLAGRPETVSVSVANVGDRAATGVGLTASGTGDGPFTVEDAAVSVGELPGGERSATTITVGSEAAGEYELTVDLTSENAGQETTSRRFLVYDEPPTIGAVYDRDDDRILDTDEIQEAVGHYVEDEPVPYTDGLTLDTEAIRRLVRWWATDDPVGGGV